MKDIKKLMITLVALLAVTTGAWAQGPWTSGDCTVTFSDGVMTVSGTGAMADYEEYNYTPWSSYDVKTIVIESGVTSIGVKALSSCSKLESVSIPASVTSIGNYAFEACGSYATALTVSFAEGSKLLTIGEEAFRSANLKSIDIPNSVTSIGRSAFSGCSNLESVSIPASVTSIGVEAFYNCGMLAKVSIYAPSLTTYGAYAFHENAAGRKIYVLSDAVDTYKAGWSAYAADIVGDLQPLASGPEVAWNKAEKTGTFTMPGGNVTLEPEYYPQATLAFKGLTAAEDAAAKTDAPLAVLADGAVTGGTLMYYVATDKNFSQADAIALAETEWSAAIPTAETVEAAGTCYVWYYIKGDAEHSDTDPEPLVVTLLPEPTYAVTFADDTAEPTLWKAEPATGVTKGETVTVTYTGAKKVIGVKAEKKAGSLIVNPVVGQVIGSDGKNYAADATLPTGVTAVAKICYVSGSGGLALALADIGYRTWDNSGSYNNGKTAAELCSAWNTSKAITGGTWKLATKDEWDNMISAAGTYSALRDGFSSVGGTDMQSDGYWSSMESNSDNAYYNDFYSGGWFNTSKYYSYYVRACLAF